MSACLLRRCMAVDAVAFRRLAELFRPRAVLYAVGGFCRDRLLGAEPHDLDICSKLTVGEVTELLEGSGFVVHRSYPRLGTACISSEGFSAEYTCFRTDSYPDGSGVHRPGEVRFTGDIALDARRRDFTANAVYFDPLEEGYTDPTGGIEDIKNRVLRAADTPSRVFSEDGLRVLRLARLAAETGFEPEEETFLAARASVRNILDIVPERILPELDRIFAADAAYPALGTTDGHRRGLELLDELGALELLLPELTALKGLRQNANYHIYDAFRHSVEAYAAAPRAIRWAALLHDIGKRIAVERTGKMHEHAALGAEAASARLAALRMPKKRAERICRLIALHMVDLKGDMSESKLRLFAAENREYIEDLAALRMADGFATRGLPADQPRFLKIYRDMLAEGALMCLADLAVTGEDAAAAGLRGAEIGEALGELLRCAVNAPSLRRRENALAFLERRAAKARKEEG